MVWAVTQNPFAGRRACRGEQGTAACRAHTRDKQDAARGSVAQLTRGVRIPGARAQALQLPAPGEGLQAPRRPLTLTAPWGERTPSNKQCCPTSQLRPVSFEKQMPIWK